MAARSTYLRRALALSAFSIAWSGVVGSIAIYVALANGSLSLLGFGADAVIDAGASVALIWRFAVETRQPERARQVEHAAERAVGLALVVLALYLLASALRSLAIQAHPDVSSASLALLVASAAILPPIALAKYRLAAHLGSGALRADSLLTGAAALLALISLASLFATDAFGFWWADAVGALLVGVIVIREGWSSLALSRSAT